MNRLTILFAGFILLALAAYVLSKRMPSLSAFMFTLALLLLLFLIGALFGWIPWN